MDKNITKIVLASRGTLQRGGRNALRNPMRFALIVSLLGTGLMFVAAMFALNGSAEQRLQTARNEIGTGIDIRPTGSYGPVGDISKALSLAQVRSAEHASGVVSAVESITRLYDKTDIKGSMQGKLVTQSGSSGATESTISPFIYGFTPGISQYPLFTGGLAIVSKGRNLTSRDTTAALTSQAMANANGWHLGSSFAVDGTTVSLVGLFESGSSLDNNSIILPIATARAIYHISGATEVTVYAESDTAVPKVVDELKHALGSQFDIAAEAANYASTLASLQNAQNTIFATLVAAIITTALIIVFAITLIVRERIQEIGLLTAIGASHWQVISQFGVEILAISGIAASIAALLLAVLGPTLAGKFGVNPSQSSAPGGGGTFLSRSVPVRPIPSASQALTLGLTPGTLALILAVGIVLAVLSSAVPAWFVARVNPADVLRSE